jgi:hypothetical protein
MYGMRAEEGGEGYRYPNEEAGTSYLQLQGLVPTATNSAFHPLQAALSQGTPAVNVRQDAEQPFEWRPAVLHQHNYHYQMENVPEVAYQSPEPPYAHQANELKALLDERRVEAQKHNNTNEFLRLEEITEIPEDIIVRSNGLTARDGSIYLEVKPDEHPTLYATLPATSIGVPNRYRKVTYSPGFRRIVRKTATSLLLLNRGPGKTAAGHAWVYKHKLAKGGKVIQCPCGHTWGCPKSAQQHCIDRGDSGCKVYRRQITRGSCLFCGEGTGQGWIADSTNDLKIPENRGKARAAINSMNRHYSTCRPMLELRSLIHPFHLEDSGLQDGEIEAFPFPIRATP